MKRLPNEPDISDIMARTSHKGIKRSTLIKDAYRILDWLEWALKSWDIQFKQMEIEEKLKKERQKCR